MYKVNLNPNCYYDNKSKEDKIVYCSYKTYITDYIRVDFEGEESELIKKDLYYLGEKLSGYDKNTRSIIQAIIDKHKINSREGFFFNREEIKKYLGIDNDSYNTELRILMQDNRFYPGKELNREDFLDQICFMSIDKDWEMFSDIYIFCEKYDRDIKQLIMNLDLSILD